MKKSMETTIGFRVRVGMKEWTRTWKLLSLIK